MCTCKDQNNNPCPCWKKYALIGFGIVALAAAGWWYWKRKHQAG
ncbi:MAG: LPXTG cell wall anchor domain-containing protein [Thermoanaerobaculia bacterium]|nr:LPXTG cell wall anchor domain-containing protein [Thermoanaerobaculia bacterium]